MNLDSANKWLERRRWVVAHRANLRTVAVVAGLVGLEIWSLVPKAIPTTQFWFCLTGSGLWVLSGVIECDIRNARAAVDAVAVLTTARNEPAQQVAPES